MATPELLSRWPEVVMDWKRANNVEKTGVLLKKGATNQTGGMKSMSAGIALPHLPASQLGMCAFYFQSCP